MDYLNNLPMSQEIQAVQNWITEYDNNIKNTENYIIKSFEEVFPDIVIELNTAPDDSGTFMVELYGLDNADDFRSKNREKAWGIVTELQEEFIESGLSLLIMDKSTETTKEYYPEQYVKLMEKRNKKENSDVSKSK